MTTLSHSCPSRIPGKVDTPKPCDPKACMRAPMRVHIRSLLNLSPSSIVRTRMWTLVETRITRFWIARLGSVHLPVWTCEGRDTRERRSRHLLFYYPKVEGR
ncbi:hypothetical protein CRG98_030403 [Punica granatum]|uniref:Uncharacterized protein n=1 Tax=Punica granatum TaxID=22663 RepID=A0A2I0IZ01_PUNGR|nr:hypothetical protein CRG98_030403 [Punica granatum]